MVNLSLSVVLSGCGVAYVVEFLDLVTYQIITKTTLNKFATLPMNLGAIYLLGNWNTKLIVAVPAATFITLYINKMLNKPVIIDRNQYRMPRM